MKTKPELSIIIPCYNEGKNLPLLLERCSEFMEKRNMELIIVDNGSSDETPVILEKFRKKYSYLNDVRVEVNQGYGFGILSGLRHAKGEFLCWTHADLQTDPADILRALERLDSFSKKERKNIFIKGQRYGRPLSDVFFTVGMSIFEMLLLRKGFWDINAQPTVFHRSFYMKWSNPPYDFSLDLFAYFLAKKYKLQIKRFPVLFGKRVHGVSHWNVDWKSKVKFIKRTLEFSMKLKKIL
jgi:glycosyltransferase involved in cell wall biosynthesis